MDRQHGEHHYWITRVNNTKDGFVEFDLRREREGNTTLAARLSFWDADGQFTLETFNGDAPLTVIEELIAEAKSAIHA